MEVVAYRPSRRMLAGQSSAQCTQDSQPSDAGMENPNGQIVIQLLLLRLDATFHRRTLPSDFRLFANFMTPGAILSTYQVQGSSSFLACVIYLHSRSFTVLTCGRMVAYV